MHPGFRFFERDNYRDVFVPRDTDAGALALADALGWGEDLRSLIKRERAAFDATLAATAASRGAPAVAARASDGPADEVVELTASLAGAAVDGGAAKPKLPPALAPEAGQSVAAFLAGAATERGAAALASGGYGAAVDSRGLGVLAEALRDVEA